MFEAAERNGMNIILGLYPGDYSKTNTADPTKYNTNLERNKMLFDEVYDNRIRTIMKLLCNVPSH